MVDEGLDLFGGLRFGDIFSLSSPVGAPFLFYFTGVAITKINPQLHSSPFFIQA